MPVTSPAEDKIAGIARDCLDYLAENPENLLAFMGEAGLTPDALRASLGTDRLQRGLIDYFAANEALLLAMCANSGNTPEELMRVWHMLNRAE